MSISAAACLLCGATGVRHCAVIGGSLRVWRCRSCAFTWVDRTDLSSAAVAPCYEDYPYNRRLREHFERMQPLYLSGFRQRLGRTMGARNLQGCAFLDVGCANGEYLWAAQTAGFGIVAGIEIDATAARQARTYGEVTDSVRRLSHTAYDLVQLKNVLTNIPDFIPFLTSCLGLLKPEGILLLDVLNQDSLSTWLRNTLRRHEQQTGRYGPLRPPYVINGFTKRAVRVLGERLGLTPIHVATSYMGSPVVPYAPSRLVTLLGRLGTLMGKGSMLVTEFRHTRHCAAG